MQKIKTGGLTIYRFEWDVMDANTYVIAEDGAILIIDPTDGDELFAFLQSLPCSAVTVLLTHEHFDHISGLNRLRDSYSCRIMSSENCSERIQSPQTNLSSLGNTLLTMYKGVSKKKRISKYTSRAADEIFTESRSFAWKSHTVYARSMQGHSLGSACYLFDGSILFSGDEILPVPTATRLPGGDTKAFWYEDIPWLESMKNQISLVCPGHGMPGKIDAMISGNVMPERYRNMREKEHAQAGDI